MPAPSNATPAIGGLGDRGELDVALRNLQRESILHGRNGNNAEAVDAAELQVWAVVGAIAGRWQKSDAGAEVAI